MSESELGMALRALLARVDHVPPDALRAASAAIGWRDLDADLAVLMAEAGHELAGLRGAPPRLLTFRSDQAIIELEISVGGGTARLLGQLEPPRAAAVTVQSAEQAWRTEVDPQGRFSVAGLSDGWLRVVVVYSDRAVALQLTEWFRS
jgi:hypothetical protein